nr:MAG TPA: hypothetical protein [Caudoviricetes sp.]
MLLLCHFGIVGRKLTSSHRVVLHSKIKRSGKES